MDFHSLKRKDLLALCKKHSLLGAGTNVEIADRLDSHLKKPVVDKEEPTSKKAKISDNKDKEDGDDQDLGQSSQIDFDNMKRKDLLALCKKYNLHASGTNAEIVQRVKLHLKKSVGEDPKPVEVELSSQDEEDDDDDQMIEPHDLEQSSSQIDLEGMKRKDLFALCKKYNLLASGTNAEIAKRISSHLQKSVVERPKSVEVKLNNQDNEVGDDQMIEPQDLEQSSSQIDLGGMKRKDLLALCKKYNLIASGTNAEIAERINFHLKKLVVEEPKPVEVKLSNQDKEDDDDHMIETQDLEQSSSQIDLEGMKRKDLLALCKKYNLLASGTNVEIAERITSHGKESVLEEPKSEKVKLSNQDKEDFGQSSCQIDFNGLKRKDLLALCKKHNLLASGTNAEIAERIDSHLRMPVVEAPKSEKVKLSNQDNEDLRKSSSHIDFDGMKRKDLLSLCKKHNLLASGSNVEIAKRLNSYFKESVVEQPKAKKLKFSCQDKEDGHQLIQRKDTGQNHQVGLDVPVRMARSKEGEQVVPPIQNKKLKGGEKIEDVESEFGGKRNLPENVGSEIEGKGEVGVRVTRRGVKGFDKEGVKKGSGKDSGIMGNGSINVEIIQRPASPLKKPVVEEPKSKKVKGTYKDKEDGDDLLIQSQDLGQSSQTDFDSMKRHELQAQCKKLNLHANGTNAEIVQRITTHLKKSAVEEPKSEKVKVSNKDLGKTSQIDFHSMKRQDLQALCKQYNLHANGTNVELAERISSHGMKPVVEEPKFEPEKSNNQDKEDDNDQLIQSQDVGQNSQIDLYGMKRKDLQALCKKHNLLAGGTNADMADRLSLYFKESVVEEPKSKKVRFENQDKEDGDQLIQREDCDQSHQIDLDVPVRVTRPHGGKQVVSPIQKKKLKGGEKTKDGDFDGKVNQEMDAGATTREAEVSTKVTDKGNFVENVGSEGEKKEDVGVRVTRRGMKEFNNDGANKESPVANLGVKVNSGSGKEGSKSTKKGSPDANLGDKVDSKSGKKGSCVSLLEKNVGSVSLAETGTPQATMSLKRKSLAVNISSTRQTRSRNMGNDEGKTPLADTGTPQATMPLKRKSLAVSNTGTRQTRSRNMGNDEGSTPLPVEATIFSETGTLKTTRSSRRRSTTPTHLVAEMHSEEGDMPPLVDNATGAENINQQGIHSKYQSPTNLATEKSPKHSKQYPLEGSKASEDPNGETVDGTGLECYPMFTDKCTHLKMSAGEEPEGVLGNNDEAVTLFEAIHDEENKPVRIYEDASNLNVVSEGVEDVVGITEDVTVSEKMWAHLEETMVQQDSGSAEDLKAIDDPHAETVVGTGPECNLYSTDQPEGVVLENDDDDDDDDAKTLFEAIHYEKNEQPVQICEDSNNLNVVSEGLEDVGGITENVTVCETTTARLEETAFQQESGSAEVFKVSEDPLAGDGTSPNCNLNLTDEQEGVVLENNDDAATLFEVIPDKENRQPIQICEDAGNLNVVSGGLEDVGGITEDVTVCEKTSAFLEETTIQPKGSGSADVLKASEDPHTETIDGTSLDCNLNFTDEPEGAVFENKDDAATLSEVVLDKENKQPIQICDDASNLNVVSEGMGAVLVITEDVSASEKTRAFLEDTMIQQNSCSEEVLKASEDPHVEAVDETTLECNLNFSDGSSYLKMSAGEVPEGILENNDDVLSSFEAVHEKKNEQPIQICEDASNLNVVSEDMEDVEGITEDVILSENMRAHLEETTCQQRDSCSAEVLKASEDPLNFTEESVHLNMSAGEEPEGGCLENNDDAASSFEAIHDKENKEPTQICEDASHLNVVSEGLENENADTTFMHGPSNQGISQGIVGHHSGAINEDGPSNLNITSDEVSKASWASQEERDEVTSLSVTPLNAQKGQGSIYFNLTSFDRQETSGSIQKDVRGTISDIEEINDEQKTPEILQEVLETEELMTDTEVRENLATDEEAEAFRSPSSKVNPLEINLDDTVDGNLTHFEQTQKGVVDFDTVIEVNDNSDTTSMHAADEEVYPSRVLASNEHFGASVGGLSGSHSEHIYTELVGGDTSSISEKSQGIVTHQASGSTDVSQKILPFRSKQQIVAEKDGDQEGLVDVEGRVLKDLGHGENYMVHQVENASDCNVEVTVVEEHDEPETHMVEEEGVQQAEGTCDCNVEVTVVAEQGQPGTHMVQEEGVIDHHLDDLDYPVSEEDKESVGGEEDTSSMVEVPLLKELGEPEPHIVEDGLHQAEGTHDCNVEASVVEETHMLGGVDACHLDVPEYSISDNKESADQKEGLVDVEASVPKDLGDGENHLVNQAKGTSDCKVKASVVDPETQLVEEAVHQADGTVCCNVETTAVEELAEPETHMVEEDKESGGEEDTSAEGAHDCNVEESIVEKTHMLDGEDAGHLDVPEYSISDDKESADQKEGLVDLEASVPKDLGDGENHLVNQAGGMSDCNVEGTDVDPETQLVEDAVHQADGTVYCNFEITAVEDLAEPDTHMGDEDKESGGEEDSSSSMSKNYMEEQIVEEKDADQEGLVDMEGIDLADGENYMVHQAEGMSDEELDDMEGIDLGDGENYMVHQAEGTSDCNVEACVDEELGEQETNKVEEEDSDTSLHVACASAEEVYPRPSLVLASNEQYRANLGGLSGLQSEHIYIESVGREEDTSSMSEMSPGIVSRHSVQSEHIYIEHGHGDVDTSSISEKSQGMVTHYACESTHVSQTTFSFSLEEQILAEKVVDQKGPVDVEGMVLKDLGDAENHMAHQVEGTSGETHMIQEDDTINCHLSDMDYPISFDFSDAGVSSALCGPDPPENVVHTDGELEFKYDDWGINHFDDAGTRDANAQSKTREEILRATGTSGSVCGGVVSDTGNKLGYKEETSGGGPVYEESFDDAGNGPEHEDETKTATHRTL